MCMVSVRQFLARTMFDVCLFYPTSNGNCTTLLYSRVQPRNCGTEEVWRVHYPSTIHEALDQNSDFLLHFSPSWTVSRGWLDMYHDGELWIVYRD